MKKFVIKLILFCVLEINLGAASKSTTENAIRVHLSLLFLTKEQQDIFLMRAVQSQEVPKSIIVNNVEQLLPLEVQRLTVQYIGQNPQSNPRPVTYADILRQK